ncbi:unnamed protein product [Coregonus sp. 'balchen']|nr:unnamed protein product [Coregonus sp. 'balchen']
MANTGHVNILLGALVHGAVLRHINLNTQARTMAYSISNVVALTTGLVGVVVGILAIILSNNKKSRVMTWSLFVVSLFGSLLATASVICLTVSVVRAIVNGGRSLLTHCRFPNAIGYASITNDCPFDPTHVYSTTLILWVPLIVTCIVQLVFSARCFSACMSFLGLPCFPHKIRPRDHGRTIHSVAPAEPPSLPHSLPRHLLHLHVLHSDPSHLKSQRQPLTPLPPPHLHHSDPSHLKSQRQPLPPLPPPHLHHSDPSHLKSQQQPLPPLPPPHLHHSDPSHLKSQQQPLRPQHQNQRGRSDGRSDRGHLIAPEEHELLEQGSQQRSEIRDLRSEISFWI